MAVDCHAFSFATSTRVDGRALAPTDAVRQAQFDDPQWPDECREVLLPWQCCVSHYVRRAWTGRQCRSMTSRLNMMSRVSYFSIDWVTFEFMTSRVRYATVISDH